MIRIEPSDRPVTARAGNQFVGQGGIGRSAHHGGHAIPIFRLDRVNEAANAIFSEKVIVARIARPNRAFRRLQANGWSLHKPRGFAKCFEPLVSKRLARR